MGLQRQSSILKDHKIAADEVQTVTHEGAEGVVTLT